MNSMKTMNHTPSLLLAALLACTAPSAFAQAPVAPPAYGASVNADIAHKAIAAALAEAARNGWPMAVAIVDPAGQLVHFQKMDQTQSGSIQVAIDKARSAALFRRPSKVFGDMLAAGNTYVLALTGAVPVEGGVPLLLVGKVVGAIGVSGGTGAQDGVVARAGAEAAR
jgi:glc operon protein GlcG